MCFSFQHLYPKSQIDVFVTIIEDDGSTLAAALTVAGLALADASIQMFDTLVGASIVRSQVLLAKNKQVFHSLKKNHFRNASEASEH